MISKFNFYDVYGYFLPGLVLLTLLWLPFGIVTRTWPSGELATALIAVPFAYIAGHVLQTMAVPAFPSTAKDSHGKHRYPSDLILDPEDNTFSLEFKEQLASRIRSQFEIDVTGEPPAVSARRRDAFFLCRTVLVRGKSVSYGEQFEGMYSLMRGLGASFLLGLFNYIGWALAVVRNDVLRTTLAITLVAAFVAAVLIPKVDKFVPKLARTLSNRPARIAKVTFFCIAYSSLCSGYLLATDRAARRDLSETLFAVAATLFLALRCFGAYEYFAREFAKAIYRDFSTYEKQRVTEESKASLRLLSRADSSASAKGRSRAPLRSQCRTSHVSESAVDAHKFRP
jgi:hypothetical protein